MVRQAQYWRDLLFDGRSEAFGDFGESAQRKPPDARGGTARDVLFTMSDNVTARGAQNTA